MANNNPRAMGINSPEQLDLINLDRAMDIYKERFGNAGNFDFFFTGNIDPEQFEALAAQYIGSLPGSASRETPQALAIFPPQQVNERFFIGQDQKSTVFLRYGTQAPYTKEEGRAVGYLSDALSIILIEEIREKLSGVYSISASGEASRAPDSQYGLSIYFPCSPDQTETLIAAVRAELQKIVENGIPEETLAKVKEKRKRSYRESLNRNTYWNAQLTSIFHEETFTAEELFGFEEIIDNFPAEAVQRMAAKLFKEEQALVVQQLPADFNQENATNEAVLEESMP
ncbi:M16 family metallopeptidase [Nitritalea halalkaliphila]|uniref:M16 family metallopeptidase n=1 Tax=Nitritalea halalkaliphila TaxID=590849 RepID=UPI000312C745|nr:insulinase family protein [Nitritalea halalkaliphila]